MSSDLIGRTLGAYEIVEYLGMEGAAEVYKGVQAEGERHVIIRLVGRDLAADPVWSARFRREAKAVAALRHANIAPALDFGEALGGHYMVSAYADGITLAEVLEQVRAGERTFTPDDIAFMVRQVAAALDHAHSQGIIHRDLSPQRILLTRSGAVTVVDFGVALLRTRGLPENSGGASFGSADYMAPEVVADFLAAAPASDMYSLGVILYETVTGQLPFAPDSDLDAALRNLTGSAPDPRLLAPDLPQTVAETILTALARSPKDRFRNALQMASQLEWAYANPTLPEPAPPKRSRAKSGEAAIGEAVQATTTLPFVRRPTTERLAGSSGLSRLQERREKARLRAEHKRIQQTEQAARRKAERMAAKAARAEKRRQFWARWGRTLATLAVVIVVGGGALYGLRAAGVISIDVQMPEISLPTLPSRPTGEAASDQPTPTLFVLPTEPPLGNPPLPTANVTPTPIQPAVASDIPPMQFTPLAVGAAGLRVHDGMAIQFVPAGQFLMGTDDLARNPNARPQHPVVLSDYWIDRTEVSNAQYRLCVEEGPCQPPDSTFYYDQADFARYPVMYVSYSGAVAYCLWLAGESGQVVGLPTEAQWEKAAGWDPVTGTPRLYPWGNQSPTYERLRFYGGPEVRPASPVGSHPAGVSAYGALDMAGNLWEWVADWYDAEYYQRTGVAVDPTGPLTGTHRVARGGSWREESFYAQATVRNPALPSVSGDSLGFRCAMTASRPPVQTVIVITPLDAVQALADMVRGAEPSTDAGVVSEWFNALGEIGAALEVGDNATALTLVSERARRLDSQRESGLLAGSLAVRLALALEWLLEQIPPTAPTATPSLTPVLTPTTSIPPTPTRTP